jgi:hypothetical protein
MVNETILVIVVGALIAAPILGVLGFSLVDMNKAVRWTIKEVTEHKFLTTMALVAFDVWVILVVSLLTYLCVMTILQGG